MKLTANQIIHILNKEKAELSTGAVIIDHLIQRFELIGSRGEWDSMFEKEEKDVIVKIKRRTNEACSAKNKRRK